MRLSTQHKFIFFANPKTGSDSVRAFLDPFSDIKSVTYREITTENPFYSHIRPVEVKAILSKWGWSYDEYFRFTFVRNPWSKLVSLYEMIREVDRRSVRRRVAGALDHSRRGRFVRAVKSALFASEHEPPPFKDWLRTIQTDGAGAGGFEHQRWRRYGTYTLDNYVSDEDGQWLVDEVIKLEELNETLFATLERIGILTDQLTIPHRNARKHRPYQSYYDDESRDLVRTMYASEIERFGYEF
jgi:hypothetical protein